MRFACVCVCGAQQEITTTREMKPIKILEYTQTYLHVLSFCVYVCVLSAQSLSFVRLALAPILTVSGSPAYTHTQRYLAHSLAPTHTLEEKPERDREESFI